MARGVMKRSSRPLPGASDFQSGKVEIDHGETGGRIFLKQGLARLAAAGAGEHQRERLQAGIMPDHQQIHRRLRRVRDGGQDIGRRGFVDPVVEAHAGRLRHPVAKELPCLAGALGGRDDGVVRDQIVVGEIAADQGSGLGAARRKRCVRGPAGRAPTSRTLHVGAASNGALPAIRRFAGKGTITWHRKQPRRNRPAAKSQPNFPTRSMAQPISQPTMSQREIARRCHRISMSMSA